MVLRRERKPAARGRGELLAVAEGGQGIDTGGAAPLSGGVTEDLDLGAVLHRTISPGQDLGGDGFRQEILSTGVTRQGGHAADYDGGLGALEGHSRRPWPGLSMLADRAPHDDLLVL
jgi:hypothetical protein